MMLGLLFLLMFLFTSEAQTFCSNLGSTVICDGGSTTITPLGRNGGVITDDRGRVTPYSIMPAPDRERSGVQPLRELDRLDSSRNRSRDRDRDDRRTPYDLDPGDALLALPE